MAVTGVLIIAIGVFATIIPFIGPLFGFGMGPDPQPWVLTTPRIVRHLIPGIAAIVGGIMLLPRMRASRSVGATLAVLAGIWLTIAPVVLGRVAAGPPAVVDILRPLAYHYGVGVLIAGLGGFALGRVSGRRAAEADETSAAESVSRRDRVEA